MFGGFAGKFQAFNFIAIRPPVGEQDHMINILFGSVPLIFFKTSF